MEITITLTEAEVKSLKQILRLSTQTGTDLDDVEHLISKLDEAQNA